MNRVYLFTYDADFGERDDVRKMLEALPEVLNWRYDIPNTAYLVSRNSAQELATAIYKHRKNDRAFLLVTEIGANRQGWLIKETWEFITNKLSVK